MRGIEDRLEFFHSDSCEQLVVSLWRIDDQGRLAFDRQEDSSLDCVSGDRLDDLREAGNQLVLGNFVLRASGRPQSDRVATELDR